MPKGDLAALGVAQSTCFTSTKVQILTPEELPKGDLAALGVGHDPVLSEEEIKKNKMARADLVERVRAEMALLCGVLMMEGACG